MSDDNFWNYTEGPPDTCGWYAVLICYDPMEGAFPQAAFWDGYTWSRKAVSAWGASRETSALALELAYEHDPDI